MIAAALLCALPVLSWTSPLQDAFEDNDSCSAAVALPLGATPALTVEVADEDWFGVTLAPGEVADVSVTADFFNAEFLSLTADAPCGVSLETSSAFGLTPARVRVGNATTSPRVVTFGARVESSLQILAYAMDAAVLPPPPCFGGPPDAFEPNDDCANASPLAAGQNVTAVSNLGDEDWYSLSVPGAVEMSVSLSFLDEGADLELAIFGSDCGDFVRSAQTETDNESLLYVNDTPTAQTIHLRVRIKGERGVCNPYSLSFSSVPTSSACVLSADDILEPNNSAAFATPVGAFAEFDDLYVSDSNKDLFAATVAPGEVVRASLTHSGSGTGLRLSVWEGGAPIGSEEDALLRSGIAGNGSARVVWRNEGAITRDVFLRVALQGSGAGECFPAYDFEASVRTDLCAAPSDAYAPNQDCQSPFLLTNFPVADADVFVRPNEPDWFAVDLAPGESVHFLILYDSQLGHLHLAEFEGCSKFSIQPSNSGFHEYSRKNMSAFTRRFSYAVQPWLLAPGEPCLSYELYVDRYRGDAGNPAALCFGDGSGAACPCGNNASTGSIGGCSNQAGQSGVLQAKGGPSLAAADFQLTVQSTVPNSFALLVSGVNLLPMTAPGRGLPTAGNGLRCVGGDFRRHGARATGASGEGLAPWGPDLLGTLGFQPGQARTFQAFYRETSAGACSSNVNTTQAVRIIARP